MRGRGWPGPNATWAEVAAFRSAFCLRDARRAGALEIVRRRVLLVLEAHPKRTAEVAEASELCLFVVRQALRHLRRIGAARRCRRGWILAETKA